MSVVAEKIEVLRFNARMRDVLETSAVMKYARKNGMTSYSITHDVGNPNSAELTTHWPSVGAAQAFLEKFGDAPLTAVLERARGIKVHRKGSSLRRSAGMDELLAKQDPSLPELLRRAANVLEGSTTKVVKTKATRKAPARRKKGT